MAPDRVRVLVVLVCILAPVSVLAVWLHNTVLDTDQYVATVAPLAHDPAVQEAIATRVTNSLVASTDLEARVGRRASRQGAGLGAGRRRRHQARRP